MAPLANKVPSRDASVIRNIQMHVVQVDKSSKLIKRMLQSGNSYVVAECLSTEARDDAIKKLLGEKSISFVPLCVVVQVFHGKYLWSLPRFYTAVEGGGGLDSGSDSGHMYIASCGPSSVFRGGRVYIAAGMSVR